MQTLRILLVEDNPGDAVLMKLALSAAEMSFTQTVIDDGAEALAHLDGLAAGPTIGLPHMILLDNNLPKVTGLEILRHIRANAAFSAVPVIVLSASEAPRDKEAALALGATAFLMKPSDLSGVHRMGKTIRDVLEG